jgi:coiled-coil domain-containing protein 130
MSLRRERERRLSIGILSSKEVSPCMVCQHSSDSSYRRIYSESPCFVETDEKAKEGKDAFDTLETSITQKQRALTASERLLALEEKQDSQWSDPYSHSVKLRRALRAQKHVLKGENEERSRLVKRLGLGADVESALENLEGEFKKETEDEKKERLKIEAEEWRKAREGTSNGEEKWKERRMEVELGRRAPTASSSSTSSPSSSGLRRSLGATSSKSARSSPSGSALASSLFLKRARKSDPFLNPTVGTTLKRRKTLHSTSVSRSLSSSVAANNPVVGLVADYGSD